MKRILITLTVFLLGSVPAAAQDAESLSDYLIAYNVAVDIDKDDYDVWVMNPEGTGKKNITMNPDVAWTYYAKGDVLYMISDRGAPKRNYYLYRTDATGKDLQKVSDLRLEDSWMSSRNNGGEMVVAGRIGDDVRHQIFIIDLKTGKYRQITDEPAARFNSPVFSPDGKQIVYVYKKDRMDREEFEDLWIMDADGSNRRRLTTYPADDKTSEWHSYHAGPPHWVGSRNFITYQSFQNGKSSLFAVTPDGKRNWKLTDLELNEGYHDWSPDGQWLAVEMYDKDNTEFGIYLVHFDTMKIKKLTDPKEFKYQQSPVFLKKP